MNPMPKTAAKPAALTPAKLLAVRLCVLMLLGMVFALLLGDFVVWAIFGTRFLLSVRFHSLLPYFQGLSVLLLYLFLWQSYRHWKQDKPHYVLVEFFVLVIGGIPLAGLIARLASKVVLFTPVAGVAKPYMSLFIPILLLVLGFACKLLTLSKVWRIVAPVFKPQDQRRIVISE